MATTPRTAGVSQLNLITLGKQSQDNLQQYLTQCQTLGYTNWNIRQMMRDQDLLYARENDFTSENQKAKRALRNGNSNKFQNITVPVVLPAVEAAVTYQASVFLTGVPLFGCVSSPDFMDQSKQMEALIDQQAIRGGWKRHLTMMFRDCFKYNFGIIECDWEKTMIPDFTTNVASKNQNSADVTRIAWEGNTIKRWDPYNSFWDLRYNVTEVADRGEFVGTNDLISRVELKQLCANTPFVIRNNIKAAFESPAVGLSIGTDYSMLSYYIPQISQFQTVNPQVANQFNWMAWSGLDPQNGRTINYKNIYQKTTLYARIIPSDFGIGVPAANTPQIWKFIIINNAVILYAQPCSLAYDTLPVLFGQPNEDGLRYQTKSLAANTGDFQNVTSAMMNSVIAARRRAVSDRVIYDPSRVAEAQINSDNPSAKIPVRPNAYGKPLNEAVYQFPYRDDQSGIIMQEIPQVIEMSNQLNGQNRAKQGQFVKGNKTMKEYDSVMANANGRDQLIAMNFEDQVFTPLKEMLKINILQFQTPATVYSRELQTTVNVDPVQLRRASLEFKVSDGLIPAEKLINGDSLGSALNAIGTTPGLQNGYNLAPMFSYLMKTQGADLSPFEKSPQQMAFEQAMGSWNQTVQMLAQQVIKAGQQVDPKQFPPQPTPQDYGYVPGSPSPAQQLAKSGAPIQSQWEQISQASSQPQPTATPQQSNPQIQ